MQFKHVMMIGSVVLVLEALDPATFLAKAAYNLIGAAAGAGVSEPLEVEARNDGLQLKHMILGKA
jgi:hypothetical protein